MYFDIETVPSTRTCTMVMPALQLYKRQQRFINEQHMVCGLSFKKVRKINCKAEKALYISVSRVNPYANLKMKE